MLPSCKLLERLCNSQVTENKAELAAFAKDSSEAAPSKSADGSKNFDDTNSTKSPTRSHFELAPSSMPQQIAYPRRNAISLLFLQLQPAPSFAHTVQQAFSLSSQFSAVTKPVPVR